MLDRKKEKYDYFVYVRKVYYFLQEHVFFLFDCV